MISSQNNVQKYSTKGHEQVFTVDLFTGVTQSHEIVRDTEYVLVF